MKVEVEHNLKITMSKENAELLAEIIDDLIPMDNSSTRWTCISSSHSGILNGLCKTIKEGLVEIK